MQSLKTQYKNICDTLKLLSDYLNIKGSETEDLKKRFQMECAYLLSALAYEDESISEKEKSFINDILGIEISDLTIQTFAHPNTNFDINGVSPLVASLSKVDRITWTGLGGKDSPAEMVTDFYEKLGSSLLEKTNPKPRLEMLYHFIAVQKEYTKGSASFIMPKTNNRIMNDISRDFFGDKAAKSPAQEATAEAKAYADAAAEENEEDPMEELQKLIGLDEIKKDVEELISLVKVQKLRGERGMKTVPVSLHLVFTGNPGTGKTTVARILARLYKQIGVLEGGQLIETDRSGLVAGYVGQTAIKTREMINQAMGGILFIDEAYSLAKEGNDFGQEAITTILKAMEDNRDKFAVIVAGYDNLMESFINSNPGLKSRFSKYFHFPDYSGEELFGIFMLNCKKYQYSLTPEAEELAKEHMQWLSDNKDENFANGRDVRNYFEKIVTKQATRIACLENPCDEDVSLITVDDFDFT